MLSFRRKPVPTVRQDLAERVLVEFNRQAGTNYPALTDDNRPSTNLSRVLGALTDAGERLTFEVAAGMIRLGLADPFWDGKPHAGHVFGEGVREGLLERAAAGERPDTPGSVLGGPGSSARMVDALRPKGAA